MQKKTVCLSVRLCDLNTRTFPSSSFKVFVVDRLLDINILCMTGKWKAYFHNSTVYILTFDSKQLNNWFLTFVPCPFHPCVTTFSRKRPRSFCQKCGRLHLNTHTPLTQRNRSGLTTPLSRHSVGTYPETSSHATYQGTLGHSRLSSLSHCGLILTFRVELVCAS